MWLTIRTQNGVTTFHWVGEVILYLYVVTNKGSTPLAGPLIVIDGSKPVLCPDVNTVGNLDNFLDQNETLTCTASYAITLEDLVARSLTNAVTATIGGVTSNQTGITLRGEPDLPVTGPITASPLPSVTPVYSPSNLLPGTTIQHRVAEGEWLVQIASCYGTSVTALQSANPQITDINATLAPSTIITVPSVGSVGKVYGPPCVTFYTIQAGDTLSSIAQRYNADVGLLQKANSGVEFTSGLTVGSQLRVPLNSVRPYYPPPVYNPSLNYVQVIEFAAGRTSATLAGVVTASGRMSYSLNAPQGQLVRVRLTGKTNEVAFVVFDAKGNVLKPMDSSPTWSGILPATGDYYIDILNVLGTSDQAYTLDVNLSQNMAESTMLPSATQPVQATPNTLALEEVELNKLPKGNFAYTLPPSIMSLDSSFMMVLQLSPNLSAPELEAQVAAASGLPTSPAQPGTLMAPDGGLVAVRSDVVEVTPFMQATLLAEDREAFEIQSLHDKAIQAVDPYSTTNWQWLIIAKKPGSQRLLLIISRQVRSNDEGHWHMIQSYKADINVNVSLSKWLASLDWKWIAGILITAVLIPGFWRWYDLRKAKPQPVAKVKPPSRKAKSSQTR